MRERHGGARLGEASVGDGSLHRVQRLLGMWGSACGGSGVHLPRKKYQVAKVSLGMPSALTPTFLTDTLIRVSSLQSPVLFLNRMSARHARSLHRTGAMPLPPDSRHHPRLHQQATWAHSLRAASGPGLLPGVAWRQLTPGKRQGRRESTCLPGAPGRDLASSKI